MNGLVRIETRAFYSTEAQGNPHPARYQPGAEAFHVWGIGEHTAQMEREAAEHRPEIGRIEQREGPAGNWAMVFERQDIPANRRRALRDFTPGDVEAFAQHWEKALDPAADFHGERIPAAAQACRTLFPGYPVAGYGALCLHLLRLRVSAAEAMRRLWAAPMPETRDA